MRRRGKKTQRKTANRTDVDTEDSEAVGSGNTTSSHAIVPINLQDGEDKEKEPKHADKNWDQKPGDVDENEDTSKSESPRRTSIFLTDECDERSSKDKLDEESSARNDQDEDGCKRQDNKEDSNNKESKADVTSIVSSSSDLKLDEGATEYNYSDASWEEDNDGDEDLDGRKSRLLDVAETRSYTYSADPDFSDAEDQKSTVSGSRGNISHGDETSIHSNHCQGSSASNSGGKMLDVAETKSYTYSADPDFNDAEDQKSTLSGSRGKVSDETSIHSSRHQGSIASNSGGMLDVDETRSYTYSADPDFSDAEDESLVSGSKGRVSEVDEKSANSNDQDSFKSGSDGKLEVDETKSYTYSADPDFTNAEDEKSVSSNYCQGSIVSSSGGKIEDGSSGVNCRRSSNASSRTEEYTRTESVVSLTEMVRKSVIEENEGDVVVYEK